MVKITDARGRGGRRGDVIPRGQYFTGMIAGCQHSLFLRVDEWIIPVKYDGIIYVADSHMVYDYSPVDLDITIKEVKA